MFVDFILYSFKLNFWFQTIQDMSSSSHALPSTNHKPLLLGHCNCDLDVIATTDAVSRRHFEKGHPCWSSNECSYDYPEVVSTNKKPLSEMSGFDLSNQSVRLQWLISIERDNVGIERATDQLGPVSILNWVETFIFW